MDCKHLTGLSFSREEEHENKTESVTISAILIDFAQRFEGLRSLALMGESFILEVTLGGAKLAGLVEIAKLRNCPLLQAGLFCLSRYDRNKPFTKSLFTIQDSRFVKCLF